MKFIAAFLLLAQLATGSPVEKVVKLLEAMEKDLKDDQAHEQQTYDKYACWCEETTDRKAKAIDKARKDMRSLGQEIVIQRGIVAQKTTEIEETTKDIKANEESQEEATSIRQKENEAYMTEQAEMQQAINALSRAVQLLGGAQAEATGFLQQGASAQLGRQLQLAREAVAAAPSRALERFEFERKDGQIAGSKLALLSSYIQQLAKGQVRYTPQSATITGILKDMYDTFAEDLESMSGEEADKNRDFEDLIATKQEELEKLQKKLKDAEKAKAEAELMEAEATQAYDDTEEQLKADVEFFDETKTACTDKSKAWKERKQIREDEIEAVGKAIEVLSSDEARELFGKAIKPGHQADSFLQLGNVQGMAQSTTEPARKAYQIVKGLASSANSLRLARLAASVHSAKVGHFEEVIGSIDTLIGELKEEATEDVEKRDECKEEYLKIESKTKDLKWKIKNNEAVIEKKEKKIEKLGKEKTATIKQIEDTEKDIEAMNKTREEENDNYKEAKKDDEDAIKLLKEAKAFLADFYKKNNIDAGKAALLQSGGEPEFEGSEDDAPEAKFKGKGHRKGQAKGVLALLSHVIEDLHGELAVAKKDEEASQLDYEKQLKAAQELVAKLEAKKVSIEESIVDRKKERDDEKKDKEDNDKDLEDEDKYKEDIKPDCDFIIDNFEERIEKRTAEMDGLNQAKDYLAGYEPPAKDALLLQAPRRSFDDTAFARISFHGIA